MIEAMVGMTILALAGTVLLLGIETSLRTATDAEDETVALGIANQIVDEVLGHRYMTSLSNNPYEYPMGASGWEKAGNGRERYNDSDDFNGFTAQPAEDIWGVEMGRGDGEGGLRHEDFQLPAGRFSRWKQNVKVYYVDETNPSIKLTGSQTSNFRCLEVTISREESGGQWRRLSIAKRIYTYVPPPP